MTPAEAMKTSLSNAILCAREAAEDLYPAASAINPHVHSNVDRTECIISDLLHDALRYIGEGDDMVLTTSTGSIQIVVRVYDGGCCNDRDDFWADTSIDVTSHKNYGSDYVLR